MFYTVTEHTPGYLADSDPYTTESAESAAEYLLSLVDSYADSLTDPDAHTRSDTLADADDIVATCAAELRDEFRPNPERGYMFTCEDPSEIAPLPRVWEITPTTYDPDGNPFADGRSMIPDAMGYTLYAVTDDGGTLCEDCVRDADNPVRDYVGKTPTDPDGWCVVTWSHTGDTDADVVCDHCRRVLAVAYAECTPGPDGWCTGGCVTRPHVWSVSGARCTRSGCNVAGTGDPCWDGSCYGRD